MQEFLLASELGKNRQECLCHFFLFPDAKAAENHSQQIFRIDPARDFPERVQGFPQIDGGEFRVGRKVVEQLQRGEHELGLAGKAAIRAS